MNGIEVFDESGLLLPVYATKSTRANLMLENLHNGALLSEDPEDMWKVPLQDPVELRVELDFGRAYNLALVRIWNYSAGKGTRNKGIRHVVIELDSELIFCGDISIAQDTRSVQSKYEMLLFSDKDEVLSKIAAQDWLQPTLIKEETALDELALKELRAGLPSRPEGLGSARDRSLVVAVPPVLASAREKGDNKYQPMKTRREVLNSTQAYQKLLLTVTEVVGDVTDKGLVRLRLLDDSNAELPFDAPNIDNLLSIVSKPSFEVQVSQSTSQKIHKIVVVHQNMSRPGEFIKKLQIEHQETLIKLDYGKLRLIKNKSKS